MKRVFFLFFLSFFFLSVLQANELPQASVVDPLDGNVAITGTDNHADSNGSAIFAIRRPYDKMFLTITAGVSAFGTLSFVNVNKGGPIVMGADFAYFFHQNIGAGIKLNVGIFEFESAESKSYSETILFAGPALYGRFGKNRLALTAGAGAGMLKWNWKLADADISIDKGYSSIGGLVSAGVNYMATRNVGIVLNIQSITGSLKDAEGNERKPGGIGTTLGVNFRF